MPETEVRELSDATRRHWVTGGPRPVRVHLWRPAHRRAGNPAVLLSHGTGGASSDLDWLAVTLSAAGFLVAGVEHHGNNYVDGYLPQGFMATWDRPHDLRFTLDHLVETEAVGAAGVAGFSYGGYTAAALLGARINRTRYAALMSGAVPLPALPEFPDLLGAVKRRTSQSERDAWPAKSAADHRDRRVGAAVLLCPAVGPLIDEASLTAIEAPVMIRWAGADDVTPAEANGMRYAANLPDSDAGCAADRAGHYWFLDAEPAGRAMRDGVAAEVADFFEARLTAPVRGLRVWVLGARVDD